MKNLESKIVRLSDNFLETFCVDYLPFCKVFRIVIILHYMVLFAGCAAFSQQHQTQIVPVYPSTITISSDPPNNVESEKGWWEIGFHRRHGYDDAIRWEYDALIALKVLKPIIENEKEITLWRFHRRAVPDSDGHRFGFFFYATRKVGEVLYQQVNENSLIKDLLKNQHIDRLSFYNINNKLRSDFGDTSDKKWPVELQKTWPYFIMGVSQTWLGLVEHYYSELKLEGNADLDEQLKGFKQIADKIDQIWKYSGNHAFLHHLNALFAYQELYILEQRLGRF